MQTQQTLVMFGVFVGISLVVTYWASGLSTTSRGFYAANRKISGLQNGWAIAGDYMSAASFLGITGLTAFYGFDGFFYGVGAFVGFLVVLLLVAEPLRNTGKYTMADIISFRLRGRSVRATAAVSTLVVSLFYMIAQMVGGGAVVHLLLPQLGDSTAIVVVAVLMMTYVLFGGMLATTWVQIIKAVLLMSAAVLLGLLVLIHYHFSIPSLVQSATAVTKGGATVNLLKPGLLFVGSLGAWNLVSFALAQALGTAGLPHILIRFFTVSSAGAARRSVAWAMVLIGAFYVLVSLMGLGAAAIVGDDLIGTRLYTGQAITYIAHHADQAPQLNAMLTQFGYIVPKIDSNLTTPLLAAQLGGSLLAAFVAAVAFATILAVVAGLTIAASSAFAHDIWFNLVRRGAGDETENLWVARGTAIVVGVLSIVLSISLRGYNVAFLVGLIFAVAASANVPVILLSLGWRRFSGGGAIAGMLGGLTASIVLIAISPVGMGDRAIFPLTNPGILSIPIGFLCAMIGSLMLPDREAQAMYDQLQVRATTGLGAEV
ncbi:MAG: cation acetate symporter [Candidatus Eremiobacteraeota bacterium]|nr:cation acetate symporter [Candidatus Eremiobacteraeota bacterium]MBV8722539.1 cation acetate symporter [Candidatus Eremiobacteraeota bacterium]